MGLMQQAYETYGYAEKDHAGIYRAEMKEPLAPVGHTITKAQIEIMLDENGCFLSASAVAEADEKTIFPVTEDSAGRTSGAAKTPHPLCDKLLYFMPGNKTEYGCYVAQLEQWESSPYGHPMLTAILKYVRSGSIVSDLTAAGLIKLDDKGCVKNTGDFIRWQVLGIGSESGPCWAARSLQNAYIKWYCSGQTDLDSVCMISGEKGAPARQHAKGVVALNGNAKLISANDSSGFTYRGRFLDDSEALAVGYVTSQKAHNALRWVVANQGVYFGGRCFVCWNPQGKALPKATGIMARRSGPATAAYTLTDYKEQLWKVLDSWKAGYPQDSKAVTAVFDAATTGRLSLVYYSELQAVDFVERLGYWDETCCWPYEQFGIQTPPLDRLVDLSFGTLRAKGYETDDAVKRQMMLQLIACRIERAKIPVSIVRSLVQRAGNMQIIPNDKEHSFLRGSVLHAACAAVRKYHIDYLKEEWEMALEPGKKDRSYQFGRWMALMEKIEKDTYSAEESREPNIIRRQLAYTTRPYATAVSVMSQLKTAYYPQLSVRQRNFYEKQIEEIMEILSEDPAGLNRSLEDSYLLGYYLQKKELYTSNKEKVEE